MGALGQQLAVRLDGGQRPLVRRQFGELGAEPLPNHGYAAAAPS